MIEAPYFLVNYLLANPDTVEIITPKLGRPTRGQGKTWETEKIVDNFPHIILLFYLLGVTFIVAENVVTENRSC